MTAVIDAVIARLDEAVRRVVDLVRWRLGDRGPHDAIGRRRYLWSTDGETWIPLIPPWDSVGTASGVPGLSDDVRRDVQHFLDSGIESPLGHELWREAWELRKAHPRSALLIGMSALEIGLKHHIAGVVPPTTWLLEELPAPPSNRLLAEYLPLLHGAGASFFTKEQVALVKKGIVQRNRVTHAGGGGVSPEFLERLLELIRTVLRTLDALAGHEWALVEAPAARTEDYPPREK